MKIYSFITPDTALETSHSSYVEEFLERGEAMVPFVLGLPNQPFSAYVSQLQDLSKGIGVPEGFVPHSTFWLLDQHGEIVAVANLRHELTPKLQEVGGHIGYSVRPSRRGMGYATVVLKETLAEARSRNLARVLLTCGKENQGSVRAIIKNGGLFDSELFVEDRNEVVQRYWIQL